VPALSVIHVDDARTWRGGEQQVLYLHRGLRARGIDSTVACPPGSAFARRLEEAALPHRTLALRGGHDLWSARRLASGPSTVLHAHTSHAHDLALWAARLGHRGPVVVSRRVDFPIRGRWSLAKYRSRRVDRYLAISSGVEAMLREAGVTPERIRRVPSGIDFDRFEGVVPRAGWREALGLDPDAPLFGNVAALAPHKDQATLLRAFAVYRAGGGTGHLVVLGEGDLRGRLEALRTELGLDDVVHLPGFDPDILSAVASLDVFVMSSELEGLGTSILDAMALGRPVVATRTGGIPDAVRHEETGLLVPPRDPEALGAALLRLARDAGLRERVREGALRHVRGFDVRRTVEATLETYRELVP